MGYRRWLSWGSPTCKYCWPRTASEWGQVGLHAWWWVPRQAGHWSLAWGVSWLNIRGKIKPIIALRRVVIVLRISFGEICFSFALNLPSYNYSPSALCPFWTFPYPALPNNIPESSLLPITTDIRKSPPSSWILQLPSILNIFLFIRSHMQYSIYFVYDIMNCHIMQCTSTDIGSGLPDKSLTGHQQIFQLLHV